MEHEASPEFVKKGSEKGRRTIRLPIFESLRQQSKGILLTSRCLAKLSRVHIGTAFSLT